MQQYSINTLMAYNDELKQEFNNNVCFRMMRESKVIPEAHAGRFLACYQQFSDAFQKAINIRAAFCDDSYFIPSFKKHFNEEIGHNELLREDRKLIGSVEIKKDSILTALTSWFAYKTMASNHYEQAVLLNICIETAAPTIYANAKPVIDPTNRFTHFKAHEGEIDCEHMQLGARLLENLTETQYKHLHEVLEECWAMLNALFKRMIELTVEN